MQRRHFLKSAGALAGASALGGFPLSAFAQKKVSFKFDTYISETAGPSGLDQWFLTELEKRSGGQVNVRRFWSASLNKVGEHLSAVRDNTSEMSLISPGYYQADLPVTRGLEWYYRMERADSLLLVCRDVYENFQPLRDEWEQRHKSKVMYWTNWNYAPMITSKPVNEPADLKGLRIRGYGVANDVIERLGGTGVPMAAPEVYTALERGLLHGVYGFDFITAVAYKLHEIAPHFTAMGDGPHAPSAVVINLDVWNSLPDEIKTICNQLTEEIYSGKYSEIMTKVLDDYVKKAESEGVKFNIWSDEHQQAARKIVQPDQVNHWVETVAKPANIDGEQMQKLISEAIEKFDPSGSLLRPAEIAAKA